jgi:outer membrane protein assembly factor BamE
MFAMVQLGRASGGRRYNHSIIYVTGRPMPAFLPRQSHRAARLMFGLAVCVAASGCSSFDSASQRVAGAITPYKVQVVQGNFVSREQVELLKPGMSRQQVRELLGTPLLTSVFHADRWDYVFTLRRQGTPSQSYRLTTFFKGDVLDRFDGDTMPTEAEFVATMDVQRRSGKVPVLEATEAQLQQQAGKTPTAPQPVAEPQPPLPTSYPPLEPAAR